MDILSRRVRDETGSATEESAMVVIGLFVLGLVAVDTARDEFSWTMVLGFTVGLLGTAACGVALAALALAPARRAQVAEWTEQWEEVAERHDAVKDAYAAALLDRDLLDASTTLNDMSDVRSTAFVLLMENANTTRSVHTNQPLSAETVSTYGAQVDLCEAAWDLARENAERSAATKSGAFAKYRKVKANRVSARKASALLNAASTASDGAILASNATPQDVHENRIVRMVGGAI